MIIKRYLVNNMNEAMTRIRYELGMDAVIISQRKIRKPGISGFFSKKIIEVTAAVDNSKDEKKKQVAEKDDIQDSINALKKIMKDRPAEKVVEEKPVIDASIHDIKKEESTEKETTAQNSEVNDKLLGVC